MNQDPKDLVVIKPPEVTVDIAEPLVTDDDAANALKECGLVKVRKENLDALNRLGIYVKGVGVLRNQRGSAFANQRMVDEVMQVLFELIMNVHGSERRDKISVIPRLTQQLGYLSSKLTESQRLMLEMEGLTPGMARNAADQDEAPNKGFIPGSDVKPAQYVAKEMHFHQAPPGPVSGSGF